MAPIDYISARNHGQAIIILSNNKSGDGLDCSSSASSERQPQSVVPRQYSIDGKVYFPSMTAAIRGNRDNDDSDSIRNVVGAVFRLTPPERISRLMVQTVSGGITNRLYRVSHDNHDDEETKNSLLPKAGVLCRIFGGEGLIDRDVETSTYAALAKQGIALQYYGRFGNGRLEEWLPNAQHLEVRELSRPDLSSGIARSLGRLHSKFVVPPHLTEHHNPKAPPTLWTQLESWLNQALQAKFTEDSDIERAAALPLSQLPEELIWLKQDVCKSDAKVGFCHNDLLAANILRFTKEEDGKEGIQLIDFEYGGINYLAYDIANHFNEFAGGTNANDDATPDYSLFPSKPFQKAFCEEYLKASGSSSDGGGDDVASLLEEIKGFVLANHLVWGIWAVNQAATQGCDEFDYLKYGSCRIQRYFLEKKDWESEHKQHFGGVTVV